MKMSMYALAAMAMASGLAAVTAARARSSQVHAGTPQSLRPPVVRVSDVAREMEAKGDAGTLPSFYSESFLKWMPLVVPLLAVMLAIGAYVIVGAMTF